jgi:hypothetical protein
MTPFVVAIFFIVLGVYAEHTVSKYFHSTSHIGVVTACAGVIALAMMFVTLAVSRSADKWALSAHGEIVANLSFVDRFANDEEESARARLDRFRRIHWVNKRIRQAKRHNKGAFDWWHNDTLSELEPIR